jgi:hypothetical protein
MTDQPEKPPSHPAAPSPKAAARQAALAQALRANLKRRKAAAVVKKDSA